MDGSLWSAAFWRATAERVVSTAAQAGLLYIGADQFNVLDFNWRDLGGFVGGGAVLSLLKSLGANALTQNGPSFSSSEVVADATVPVLTVQQAESLPQMRDAQGRFVKKDVDGL